MIELQTIRQALKIRESILLAETGHSSAAVAMLLIEGVKGVEVLFIERAAHPQDPWSGNLAFPGGRFDAGDADLQMTAERETLEEIGLDLCGAECLGQLDDIVGAYLPVKISGYVYLLAAPAELRLNHEVTRTTWFPLRELGNPLRHTLAKLFWHGKERQVHGIQLDDDLPLLWGITYRLVIQFLDRLQLIDPELCRVKDD
jgi:8-oxo-dGTP pyrophosphatase MutT (NUDIX family)